MRQIKKTNYFSWVLGKLPKGCRLCVEGKKEVIFVTGVCSEKCYFCPISEHKKDKDVIYANEVPVEKDQDLIDEAKLCQSGGAGITGGDPLSRLDRTIGYIKLLKKQFGKEFHIHLYTPLTLVTKEVIKKLETAGLDEIRFHPNLKDDTNWERILIETTMDKGIEIPVIPSEKENTIKLIDYIKDKIKFLNLNELELADTTANHLAQLGFEPKDEMSYGVKGSEKLAKELVRYCTKTDLNVHYCTTKLKDKIQLANRIKRRAKNAAKPYDKIMKGNSLKRGAIYLKGMSPDFGAMQKIAEMKPNQKSGTIKQLQWIKRYMLEELLIPIDMVEIDTRKLRVLTSIDIARKNTRQLKKKGFELAIVEELATYDQFEIENEPL